MKIVKLIFILFLSAFLVGEVTACDPPIKFAQEHDCALKYASEKSVNTYTCGNYKIIGDCKGGVISETQPTEQNKMFKVAFVIIIIILVNVGLFVAFRKLREDDDDDDGKVYY